MCPCQTKGTSVPWWMACTSADAHGWLHQLQVCKLLQHRDKVVCPKGLNSELEALQFTFPELPLWDVAAPGNPSKNWHTPRSGPWLCAAWGYDNYHSGSCHYTGANPPSSWYYWGLPMTSPWPSTCISRGLWNGCSRLPPQPQPLSPSIVCLGESHHQWPWGSTLNRKNRRSPQAKGDRLSHPHPDGNPHTDPSMGGHTRWQPQHPSWYSPPAPAYYAKDTRGSQYVHISPQGHTSCPVR